MAHSTQFAKDLKAAREAKGLSQRALSDLIGMPQSHISRIEKGGVDLRLSSLVELARALDLEVTLVPRKNLSAVRSITRPRLSATKELESAARASKELQRLRNTIAKISHEHPAIKELAQLQRRVTDLSRLTVPTTAIDDIRRINDALKLATGGADTPHKLAESLNQLQQLRSQLAHAQADWPQTQKRRPVYSLEEGDHG